MAKGKRKTIKAIAIRRPPPMAGEAEFDANWDKLRSDYKHNREAFCREYIRDFNGAQTMRRLGSKSKTPWVQASEWLQEPYTQWFLAQLLEKADEKAIVTKNQILAGLKQEAHYFGPDGGASARIAAWRSLAKILGIEITKLEGNVNLGGGVMLLPFSGTPEEWEKSAAAAQEKLKQDVRT